MSDVRPPGKCFVCGKLASEHANGRFCPTPQQGTTTTAAAGTPSCRVCGKSKEAHADGRWCKKSGDTVAAVNGVAAGANGNPKAKAKAKGKTSGTPASAKKESLKGAAVPGAKRGEIVYPLGEGEQLYHMLDEGAVKDTASRSLHDFCLQDMDPTACESIRSLQDLYAAAEQNGSVQCISSRGLGRLRFFPA